MSRSIIKKKCLGKILPSHGDVSVDWYNCGQEVKLEPPHPPKKKPSA